MTWHTTYLYSAARVWGLGIGMFLRVLVFLLLVVALTAGSLISSGQASFLQVLLITTAGLTWAVQSLFYWLRKQFGWTLLV